METVGAGVWVLVEAVVGAVERGTVGAVSALRSASNSAQVLAMFPMTYPRRYTRMPEPFGWTLTGCSACNNCRARIAQRFCAPAGLLEISAYVGTENVELKVDLVGELLYQSCVLQNKT